VSGNVTVGVTNTHPLDASPVQGDYTVCGQYHPGDNDTDGPTVSVQCSQPLRYRYVIVQVNTTDRLSLCEVEVYTPEGTIESKAGRLFPHTLPPPHWLKILPVSVWSKLNEATHLS